MQVGDDALAIGRPQPLVRHFADLRRVEAHPDLLDVSGRADQKSEELLEVARPVRPAAA